jgi:NMD protein affecting ribosome stability and mRNA decay
MATPAKAPLSSELRKCVVCGNGSHRTDWIQRYSVGETLYVACDYHTDKECEIAINKAESELAAERANAAKPPAPLAKPTAAAAKN